MNHLARLQRAGLGTLLALALAGCVGPVVRTTTVGPTDRLSVDRCTEKDCSIRVEMNVDAAGCSYTLPAFYVVPPLSVTITWTLVPAGGSAAQFRFPAGPSPVIVKATKQAPWTLPDVPQAAASYMVERSTKVPQATSYGLNVEFLPAGSKDWQACPQLDPMIISTD